MYRILQSISKESMTCEINSYQNSYVQQGSKQIKDHGKLKRTYARVNVRHYCVRALATYNFVNRCWWCSSVANCSRKLKLLKGSFGSDYICPTGVDRGQDRQTHGMWMLKHQRRLVIFHQTCYSLSDDCSNEALEHYLAYVDLLDLYHGR